MDGGDGRQRQVCVRDRRRAEDWQPKIAQKANKKMIGWAVTELAYNDSICGRLGMEAPLDVAEANLNAYHIYTDGSFTGFRNIHKARWRDRVQKREEAGKAKVNVAKAGWAAVFFARGASPKIDSDQRPEW